jgi:activator of HSP90 ATPase
MATTIHQEVSIPASPNRVYEAIINGKQFGELTGAPAQIDGSAGGAFSCFGGHISGRNVDLQPGKRIVQAWRAQDWDDGLYSIVRFELAAEGSGTALRFDHVGFPEGAEAELAPGWQKMYWEPLTRYLS